MKFRKKPVVIEAVQFDGSNESMCRIIHELGMLEKDYYDMGTNAMFKINTLEGTHTVRKGDWVIKGVKGEFYPCRPDIFAATYEAMK